MAVRTLSSTVAVYRIARSNHRRYRHRQVRAAACGGPNIAEGLYQFVPAEFSRFLLIARASIGESRVHLLDGVDRGYFAAADCTGALNLADRAMACIASLKTSLEPFKGDRPRKGRGPGS